MVFALSSFERVERSEDGFGFGRVGRRRLDPFLRDSGGRLPSPPVKGLLVLSAGRASF